MPKKSNRLKRKVLSSTFNLENYSVVKLVLMYIIEN